MPDFAVSPRFIGYKRQVILVVFRAGGRGNVC